MRQQQSGIIDELILQQALEEYRAQYLNTFSYVQVWRILKDRVKWKRQKLSKVQGGSSKKSKTSESTSHNTSESTHWPIDLNVDVEENEVEERPVGREKAKKKAATSTSSAVPNDPCYTALMDRMKQLESSLWVER